MFGEEEIWQTIVHAWWGVEMPAQSAVSAQDVEVFTREAELTLQDTTTKTTKDITLLTQETGVTIGRVEEAFGEMESRSQSMGASLQ